MVLIYPQPLSCQPDTNQTATILRRNEAERTRSKGYDWPAISIDAILAGNPREMDSGEKKVSGNVTTIRNAIPFSRCD